MNFDVGDSRKLGTLNDIYKTKTRADIVLPSRKFDVAGAAVKYAAEQRLLRMLPHYMGYGLVVCNPQLWLRFTATGSSDECKNASLAYASLKSNLKTRLEFDDGSAKFRQKWDPKTRRMVMPPLESLLDESPGKDEYFVVPKYFALTMFGPKSVDCYTPPWLNKKIASEMLQEEPHVSLDMLLLHLCTSSRPPPHSPIRKQMAAVLTQKLPLTQPLLLDLELRALPLEQVAIVVFCVHQMRSSALQFASHLLMLELAAPKQMQHELVKLQPKVQEPHNGECSNEVHQFSGTLVAPCGLGKTKMSVSVAHSFYDPVFDQLEHNDFGVIEHTVTNAIPETMHEPQVDIMSAFFSAKNKPPPPPKQQGLPKVLSDWLAANPNVRNRRETGPLQTGKILWVADYDDLLDQAAEAMVDCLPGVRVGLIKGSSRPDPRDCDIVIASIRTIACQDFPPGYFENFTFAFFDEAHRNMAKYFRAALKKLAAIPFSLFLTATPRHDQLRMIGGPVFVVSTRPYVKQQHVVIMQGGIPPSSRPIRSKQSYNKSSKSDYDPGNVDKSSMYQDMVLNQERNKMMVDVIYAICTGDSNVGVPGGYRVDKVGKMPPPVERSTSWEAFHKAVYENVEFLDRKNLRTTLDFAWSPSATLPVEYCATKSNRVPVIYSRLVTHIILLQHMFAQKWLDEARSKPEYAGANLAVVRTGLRQLAVVNMDLLSPDQRRRFKWIGGGDGPTFSCASVQPVVECQDHVQNFAAPFWQAWFDFYPIGKRFAVEAGKSYPFKLDEKKQPNAQKKSSEKKKEEPVETKKYTSSDWMYKSQYYWTPVYYPLPSAVDMDAPAVKEKKPKKKRKAADMEGDGEVPERTTTTAPKKTKLFKRMRLNDTRPALDRASGQLLATFGLYIGIGNHPSPSALLSDIKLVAKTPHNREALLSDYVFANYAIASTGIDREAIDTTVMAMPYKDPEQLHGRALRLCDTKQDVLHLEFAEPSSPFTQQTLKHIQGMEQQQICSQVYVVSKK